MQIISEEQKLHLKSTPTISLPKRNLRSLLIVNLGRRDLPLRGCEGWRITELIGKRTDGGPMAGAGCDSGKSHLMNDSKTWILGKCDITFSGCGNLCPFDLYTLLPVCNRLMTMIYEINHGGISFVTPSYTANLVNFLTRMFHFGIITTRGGLYNKELEIIDSKINYLCTPKSIIFEGLINYFIYLRCSV